MKNLAPGSLIKNLYLLIIIPKEIIKVHFESYFVS